MRIRQRLITALAAALVLSGSFPAFITKAEQISEETITEQETAEMQDAGLPDGEEAVTGEQLPDDEETVTDEQLPDNEETVADEQLPDNEETVTDEQLSDDEETVTDEQLTDDEETVTGGQLSDEPSSSKITAMSVRETGYPTETEITEETPEPETAFPVPDEAPAFHARIKFHMGYTVTGTFTDFTPDIVLIETLFSTDGENWQTVRNSVWNLFSLGTDDEAKLQALQNQTCLVANQEPLKSYAAGDIDHFDLKLRITKKNGLSYETQSAAITRGGVQPLPEGTECRARFSPAIIVREPASPPYRYCQYGRYQLTISADATAEDISALLPDTLPVEIQFDRGADFIAIGVVDCPVTWKPLSLPRLSAGESITIPDAAEEILVPDGATVSTPLGTFRLDKPLSLDSPPSTDEVRLVLNVSAENPNPTGVLRAGLNGLEMAFHYNPTGAASIQAYILTEGESKWTELSGLSLLEEFRQPSTANSGYALLLHNDQEPYRSYLAATKAGETPTPFFVGLKINGGIYDGRQLILAWPDIYEQLPDLPKVGGAEGNEGNAGAYNREDSTDGGQRPGLQTAEDNQEKQPQTSAPDTGRQTQPTTPAGMPEPVSAISESQSITAADESVSVPQGNQFVPGQEPDLSPAIPDTADTFVMNQEDRLPSAPLAPSAPPAPQDVTNTKENLPAPPAAQTAIEHPVGNERPIPLLPVTAVVTTVVCIGGAAACKAAGYRPFYLLVRTLRSILYR